MLNTVLPVFAQAAVHDFVLLRVDGVFHDTRIAHRYLLVPFLLAYFLLPAEGIEARNIHAEVGQGQGNGGVAHVLRRVNTDIDGHSKTGEARRVVDRTGTCRLRQRLRIVH